MKKYILIWDVKLQQMFKIYVNNGQKITKEGIITKLLRANIDIKNDIGRYQLFNSDSSSILPYYYKSKMEAK
tara:strand:- start:25913 stop:26128 length:216 start_codon:yes stop_codon:yes gene_type:complete